MTFQIEINQVAFADPEEGVTATTHRLAQVVTHHWVSHEALQVLVLLSSMACHPEKATTVPLPGDAFHELEFAKLIKRPSAGKVELI